MNTPPRLRPGENLHIQVRVFIQIDGWIWRTCCLAQIVQSIRNQRAQSEVIVSEIEIQTGASQIFTLFISLTQLMGILTFIRQIALNYIFFAFFTGGKVDRRYSEECLLQMNKSLFSNESKQMTMKSTLCTTRTRCRNCKEQLTPEINTPSYVANSQSASIDLQSEYTIHEKREA